jgi:hypothetical protein
MHRHTGLLRPTRRKMMRDPFAGVLFVLVTTSLLLLVLHWRLIVLQDLDQIRTIVVNISRPYVYMDDTDSDYYDACDCADADGILFISRVIRKAGAGTMFFQSIVDSLLYAEKYNLVPYIWINDDENQPCYDPNVHGVGPNRTVSKMAVGTITNLKGKGDMACDTADGTRPGPPSLDQQSYQPKTYTLVGNGMWQSYFQPIPKLSTRYPLYELPQHHPYTSSSSYCFEECSKKPVFEMTRSQVMPDMHRCSEFAVRGWAFRGIPNALLPKAANTTKPSKARTKSTTTKSKTTIPMQHKSIMADWLWQHRKRAAPIVRRYFHLQPWLQARVDAANNATSRVDQSCLAVHIRLTDKASGRDKKGLDAYRPYMYAFAKAITTTSSSISSSSLVMKYSIYIATDDATVIPTIQNEWSPMVSSRVVFQPNTFRSHEEDLPTFKLLANDKHRSNTEALVDMYALSKCDYLIHGYSGMAEAVVYMNPELHSQSVNIDDEDRMTPKQFERLVRTTEEKRKSSSRVESYQHDDNDDVDGT